MCRETAVCETCLVYPKPAEGDSVKASPCQHLLMGQAIRLATVIIDTYLLNLRSKHRLDIP
jgi:hypothetical protein